jgi:hypothetical protein
MPNFYYVPGHRCVFRSAPLYLPLDCHRAVCSGISRTHRILSFLESSFSSASSPQAPRIHSFLIFSPQTTSPPRPAHIEGIPAPAEEKQEALVVRIEQRSSSGVEGRRSWRLGRSSRSYGKGAGAMELVGARGCGARRRTPTSTAY